MPDTKTMLLDWIKYKNHKMKIAVRKISFCQYSFEQDKWTNLMEGKYEGTNIHTFIVSSYDKLIPRGNQ